MRQLEDWTIKYKGKLTDIVLETLAGEPMRVRLAFQGAKFCKHSSSRPLGILLKYSDCEAILKQIQTQKGAKS